MSTRLLSIILLCSLAMAMIPPAQAQDILGGPAMDACIIGSREIYPGQTVPLQIAVMNKGVLTYALGFSTPDVVATSGNGGYSYNASASSSTQSYTNAQYAAALGQASSLQQQYVSQAAAQSASFSSYGSGVPFGTVELNTGTGLAYGVTTAFGMSCWLSTAGTPIELVSDPHFVVGSLCAGSVFSLTYIVRVSRGATPGIYALPLTVTYKRLADELDLESAWGPTLAYNNYVEETQVVVLYVVVKEMFDLVVCDITTENMVPGSDGIVSLKVCNLGNMDAEDAVVYLLPSSIGLPQGYSVQSGGGVAYGNGNGNTNNQLYGGSSLQYGTTTTEYGTGANMVQSMLVPAQSSQFLGHMGPGAEQVVRFKVSISPDAEAGDYPLSAVVSYTDPWNVHKGSNLDTFGIHVEPEMKFAVDASPITIKCGKTCEALLNLTNTGPLEAKDAVVRMNALDPFVVSYDTAYLGDMSPGETINTTFGIKVKPDAVPSTYYVTLEVKYYDSEDDPHVTKIIRKAIVVLPPPTLVDTLLENWPLLLGLGAVILIGLLYVAYGYAKRRKKPPARLELPGGAVAALPAAPPGEEKPGQ